jgi:phenylacetate-CoA ligase
MYASPLYRHSPVWAQEALISLRAWSRARLREGRTFERIRAEVNASQWYDREAIAHYRMEMLSRVLHYAHDHCAFYRERFREAGFGPDDVRSESDLARFPLLDKSEVRAAGRSLLSASARRPLFEGATSGTTGSPLKMFQDLRAINRENAFIQRQLDWAGLTPNGRRAWLRGDMVTPATQTEPPFWRMSRAENMLMLSSYHLSEGTALAYLEALSRFDPMVIQAYPSSIGFLASWLETTGRSYGGKALTGIVSSSESLSDTQRTMIERRFGCKVFDWYGQFERIAAIGTCEHGTHHVMADYSLSEFLPVDDRTYEVVGTGFNNFAMPLIRYRTGDLVELAAPDASCPCRRSFPIVRAIHGRNDDVVKLPDGRHIGRLDHIFKGVNGVIEAQIRQEVLDRIDILVVPGAGYGSEVERLLMRNARDRIGNGVAIAVRTVGSIPRTRNGKFRGVVCKV